MRPTSAMPTNGVVDEGSSATFIDLPHNTDAKAYGNFYRQISPTVNDTCFVW